MPQPQGLGFVLQAKFKAYHVANTVNRRLRTSFLIHLNCATVYWLSNNQTSVESSSFGSELVAMKQCCEYLRGIRYKIRMIDIPCEGPAYISSDNQSVLENMAIPDSTLKKKLQSIAYHFIPEGAARDEWRTSYVSTHYNEAYLPTKLIPSGEKEKVLIKTFCTISFKQTQQGRLSYGVCTKTMMVHTTPKSESGCRTILTTICWISLCGRSTFLFIVCFCILNIGMPT